MNTDPIIGQRTFTDGVTRDVYLDATSQYVLGDDGRQVRGVWLMTDREDVADAPFIVGSGAVNTGR
jgi:hypothetical protein